MVPSSPQPDAAAPAPDWAVQKDEILCPLCDYNLRGLSEPRCPECGYRFAWAELMDEARRRHPYLFEQRLRRPIWSFFRTVGGGWMPGRFWKSIHPALPVRPGRLLLYWALVMLPLLLGMGVVAIGAGTRLFTMLGAPVPPDWARLAQMVVTRDLWPMLVWGCWPALLLLTLMIFRISMRRARVRTAHVLRCITYSCDSLLLLNVPTLAIAVSDYFQPGLRGWRYTGSLYLWLGWGIVLWLLLTTWRLGQAYRHYLRFDHPLATVLVSQFIVFLIVLIGLLRLGSLR